MFCANCGRELVEGTRVCAECRHPVVPALLRSDDVPPAPAQPAPMPTGPPAPAAVQAVAAPAMAAPIPMPVVATQVQSLQFGGFWLRFVASIADGVVFGLVYLLLFALLTAAERASMARMVFDPAGNDALTVTNLWSTAHTVLPWLVVWLYFAGLEASRLQATPGKRLLGLRVTDLAGRRASIIRTSFRNAFKPLSAAFLMIGFLMAGITARKQALHDMFAGCLILRR